VLFPLWFWRAQDDGNRILNSGSLWKYRTLGAGLSVWKHGIFACLNLPSPEELFKKNEFRNSPPPPFSPPSHKRTFLRVRTSHNFFTSQFSCSLIPQWKNLLVCISYVIVVLLAAAELHHTLWIIIVLATERGQCNTLLLSTRGIFPNKFHHEINHIKTKRRHLYLKHQTVPRCRHFSSRL